MVDWPTDHTAIIIRVNYSRYMKKMPDNYQPTNEEQNDYMTTMTSTTTATRTIIQSSV